MLFLRKEKKILSIQTKKSSKHYTSSNDSVSFASPIFLWQDEATASAAEVFIAALTDNNKAVSVGKKTFGKGTTQDVIELSDGSALVLTTGHLRTPSGLEYHGIGLAPSYELASHNPDTADYVAKTAELIRQDIRVSLAGRIH